MKHQAYHARMCIVIRCNVKVDMATLHLLNNTVDDLLLKKFAGTKVKEIDIHMKSV